MSTSKISGVAFCLIVASILLNWEMVLVSAQQQSTVAVIQGATVITGTGAPAIRNAAIVIEGGRIRDIGPRNEVKVPNNAQVTDARGK
jgi:imidazolonepropionase-like amidohydrolase